MYKGTSIEAKGKKVYSGYLPTKKCKNLTNLDEVYAISRKFFPEVRTMTAISSACATLTFVLIVTSYVRG